MKLMNIIIRISLITIISILINACVPENINIINEATPGKTLYLLGPSTVTKGDTFSYETVFNQGVTYTWNVLGSNTIVKGENTYKIDVKFNKITEKVKLISVTAPGKTETFIEVKVTAPKASFTYPEPILTKIDDWSFEQTVSTPTIIKEFELFASDGATNTVPASISKMGTKVVNKKEVNILSIKPATALLTKIGKQQSNFPLGSKIHFYGQVTTRDNIVFKNFPTETTILKTTADAIAKALLTDEITSTYNFFVKVHGPTLKFKDPVITTIEGNVADWKFTSDLVRTASQTTIDSYKLYVAHAGTESTPTISDPVDTGKELTGFSGSAFTGKNLSITGQEILTALGKTENDFPNGSRIYFFGVMKINEFNMEFKDFPKDRKNILPVFTESNKTVFKFEFTVLK